MGWVAFIQKLQSFIQIVPIPLFLFFESQLTPAVFSNTRNPTLRWLTLDPAYNKHVTIVTGGPKQGFVSPTTVAFTLDRSRYQTEELLEG